MVNSCEEAEQAVATVKYLRLAGVVLDWPARRAMGHGLRSIKHGSNKRVLS